MDQNGISQLLSLLGTPPKGNVSRTGWIKCSCPFARVTHQKGRDVIPSFGVKVCGTHERSQYKCLSCGERGGSMTRLVKELAWKGIRSDAAIVLVRKLETEAAFGKVEAPKPHGLAARVETAAWASPEDRSVVLSPGRALFEKIRLEYETMDEARYAPYNKPSPYWIRERGLTRETCEAWGLGGDPNMQRALIPVRDIDGFLVGVTGRLYAKECKCGDRFPTYEEKKWPKGLCPRCGRFQPPKYLHTHGYKKELFLFGEHMLDRKVTNCYLTESHFDVPWLWQNGYPNSLATQGASVSNVQIEKIVMLFESVILLSHGDKAGDAMANGRDGVVRLIDDRIMVTVKRCPEGSDVGEMTPAELVEFIGPPPGVNKSIVSRVKGEGPQERLVFYTRA